MERNRRFTVLWTVWMCAGAIAFAVGAYALTGSLGWTVVAVLIAGPVCNAIGQVITQPMRATRGPRS